MNFIKCGFNSKNSFIEHYIIDYNNELIHTSNKNGVQAKFLNKKYSLYKYASLIFYIESFIQFFID
jgi:hypothetical protein